MGWTADISNEDPDFDFLTIEARRDYSQDSVVAVLEFAFGTDGIAYSVHKSSFKGYGIESLMEGLTARLTQAGWLKKDSATSQAKEAQKTFHTTLLSVLRNFDRSARQLARARREDNQFRIRDEHDAQDLLHALLRAYFDDVRPEEFSPSVAGSSSRINFLLKHEQVAVEIKVARESLKQKQIGEQLIVDISRYDGHPSCKSLYCLVFDPNNHIANPTGLEADLSKKHNDLDVHVIVTPK